MNLGLDRNRLFVLIGASEEDFRDLIRDDLIAIHGEHKILGTAYEKASERLAGDADSDAAGTELAHYLDLGDEIEILHRHRDSLPDDAAEALRTAAVLLEQIKPIRNRVMHRRPLLPDDFATTESAVLLLESSGFRGPSLADGLAHIRADPGWSPTAAPKGVGRVLNNLPLPDFDETGLIGRAKELEQLKKRIRGLAGGRAPLLTVVGPGGVGKTALTVQALHDLVGEPDCPFDLVSWVSLKTERLTSRGIDEIRDAVLSVDEALPVLASTLDEQFTGSVEQLADGFEGLSVLLAIDNLETVLAEEVLDLIDALPASVSYVVTSRVGVGELERKFPLAPLEPRFASDLFRRLARARGLEHLARLTQSQVDEVLEAIGTAPLALRWYVSGVEAGADPKEILNRRADLVRFCVENVFEGLAEQAREVGELLCVLARPVTIQDLNLYLPRTPPDQIRESLQALYRRILIVRDVAEGTLAETYEASEALVDYSSVAGFADTVRAAEIRTADVAFRREEERHRIEAASDLLLPNVIQGGPERRGSILMVRDALNASKAGRIDEALSVLDRALSVDPEFWEIWRVRGFVLSHGGKTEEATGAYERSVALAPDPRSVAICKYFFSGHLTMRAMDSVRAVDLAREAHAQLALPKSAVELAKALAFVDQHDEAIELLEHELPAEDPKLDRIATTMLIKTLMRKAEQQALRSNDPDSGVKTLARGMEVGLRALDRGTTDLRLRFSLVSCASACFRFAELSEDMTAHRELLAECSRAVEGCGAEVQASEEFRFLRRHGQRLVQSWPSDSHQPEGLLALLGAPSGTTDGQRHHLDGTVRTWLAERGFGFIRVNGELDVYCHASKLVQPWQRIEMRTGAQVRFVQAEDAQGRPTATEVEVMEESVWPKQGRVLRLLNQRNDTYLAADLASGATVGISRLAIGDGLWADLRPKSTVRADVSRNERHQLFAVQGTIELGTA